MYMRFLSNMIALVLCFFLLVPARAAIYRLDDDQYEQMPPIMSLDLYHSCLRDVWGRYCTGYAVFVSDEPSPLLTMIEEFSEHTNSHYNHTKALFGTCISRECEELYDLRDPAPNLGHIFEACLNRTVSKKYNLKVKMENYTCVSRNDPPRDIHLIDIAVAAAVFFLIILNVIGTLYDVYAPRNGKLAGEQLILCFSMKRNFKSMTSRQSLQQTSESFTCLQGTRAILMILVTAVHSMLIPIMFSSNPNFIESLYDSAPLHLVHNGTVAMQTFLFMSALLLVYQLQSYCEEKPLTWAQLPGFLLKRWLRLTPSYALVLGVTATWLRHVGSGPIWNEIIVAEGEDCRRNWWTHILYINNYFDDSKCMPQAWYVAVDTQLFVLGMVVCIFCQKLGRRKVVLSLLFIIGMILPALHTYFQDLDGPLLISPADVLDLFMNDETFHALYIRGHTNICCYVMGMAAGYLIYHLKKNNFDGTKYRKWRPLLWCLAPLLLSVTVPLKVFYEDGPRVSLVYRIALAALHKPAFGLIIGTALVATILNIESFWSSIFQWKRLAVLGRISYSAYLIHVLIIRSVAGVIEEPIRVSNLKIAETVLFLVTLTFLAAAVFWVMVEEPFSQIVKYFLATNANKVQEKIQEKAKQKVEEEKSEKL